MPLKETGGMADEKKPACGFIPGMLMPTGNAIPASGQHTASHRTGCALWCSGTQAAQQLVFDMAFAPQMLFCIGIRTRRTVQGGELLRNPQASTHPESSKRGEPASTTPPSTALGRFPR